MSTFSLASIDSALEEVKSRAKPHGEIITYLPTGSAGDIDSIELEILIASKVAVDVLRTALVGQNVRIEEVERAHRGGHVEPGGSSLAPPSLVAGALPSASLAPPRVPSIAPPADNGREGRDARDGGGEPPRRHSILPGAPGGGGGGGGGNRELSLRSVSQTVRVDIRKLDHLMNIVGELVHRARRDDPHRGEASASGAICKPDLAGELHRLHRTFERHLDPDAERHPRGAHGSARAGLRQARAHRPADLARARTRK